MMRRVGILCKDSARFRNSVIVRQMQRAGVADAIHIAVYYVAQTLVEQLTEGFGGPAASQYATRSGVAANIIPGGMSVQPYVPQPAGGQYQQRSFPSTVSTNPASTGTLILAPAPSRHLSMRNLNW
jgi:hypothetical protein